MLLMIMGKHSIKWIVINYGILPAKRGYPKHLIEMVNYLYNSNIIHLEVDGSLTEPIPGCDTV